MSFLSQHAPALPVIVPLLAAAFCVFLPKGRWPWLWATLVSWATFFVAVFLLLAVQRETDGVLTYDMGNWPSPVGIVYRIDILNALVMALVSGMAAFIMPYAKQSIIKEVGKGQENAFYALFLVCFAGLMGVAATGDAFNVFVFLEISSLSTYALVAMGARQDRRALTAAYTYLVLGTIGATFFVIGLGLLYQATGTLNMIDLHERLIGQDNKVVRAGFAFIVTGLGLKIAMFPIHRWLPNAYTFAPSAVTAFLASTATKVALYAMLRFVFTVFGMPFAFLDVALVLFLVLGLTGMLVASLIAVFRDDVKQMLAFSSVAQLGYMLVGISLATVDGVAAATVHLFNHALMKAALFMAVGVVVYAVGSHQLPAFRGLGKRMPLTASCFIIAGLSLVGVPFTAGFISKYVLIGATFDTVLPIPVDPIFIVGLIVASSLLAVGYIGRVAYEMFLADPPDTATAVRIPLLMTVPMVLMTAANVYVGMDAEQLVELARRGASILLREGVYGGSMP